MDNVARVGLEGKDAEKRVPLSFDQNSSKYERTYQPGRGFRRYGDALKNLIPIRRKGREAEGINVMPFDSIGLYSSITVSWLSKLLYKAHSEGITMEEIPAISPYDACNYNVDRLELLWEDELARKGPEKASLFSVVWKFSRTRIFFSSLLYAVCIIVGSINSSLVTRKLLEYIQTGNGNYEEGVKWVLLLTLAEFLRTVCYTWSNILSYRTALRVRSACFTLLYKKIIRLNNSGDKRIGQVINMYSNDVQRIFEMILYVPMIVGAPLLTMYAMFFVVWLFDPIALLGIATFLIFYPLQYMTSYIGKYLQTKAVKISDTRLRLMNEILDCIKLIKTYAWEKRFGRDLKNIRKKEQGFIFKFCYWQISNRSVTPNVPVISAIITFIAIVNIGGNLTTAEVFSYTSLLDARFGFSFLLFQWAIEAVLSSRISFNRFESILNLEDKQSVISKPVVESQAIAISHGAFAHNTSVDEKNERRGNNKSLVDEDERKKLNELTDDLEYNQVLFDISFEATKGKLVGICGHVGSGKTSLLLAAMGQLRVMEGKVMRDGSIAYVSQQAWIINATLRENILFGAPYDDGRYHEAIHASSLIQDIEIMPAGDQTEIGEKGVNLSGGQKQRVALARALYADRDIYVLDDPLSAVDSRVGSDIFENFILGALRGRTVLFVTHQIQYLNRCDDIYMIRGGRIIEHGTHDDLMKHGNEYAIMVSSISAEGANGKTTGTDGNTEVLTKLVGDIPSGKENKRAIAAANSDIGAGGIRKTNTLGATLTVADELQRGVIKAQTYRAYVIAAGGYFTTFLVITTFLITAGSSAFSSWWLALWIEAGGGNTTVVRNNVTLTSDNINDNPDVFYYQVIYGGSVGVILLSIVLRSFIFAKATIKSSTKLHNDLFEKVINSPMRFFDTTPTGRIQHLFSRDMDEVDNSLPVSLMNSIQYVLMSIFTMAAICLLFPWVTLVFCVLATVYYFFSNVFRAASRDLRRIENQSRVPLISIVTATIQGLSTIHAFGKEADFIKKFTEIFNENSKCVFACHITTRWLAVRLEMLAVMIIGVTAFMVVGLQDQVSPALAGLAVSYAANLAGVLQFTARLLTDTEMRFTSVDKIYHYIRTLTREGETKVPTVKLQAGWPVAAEIRFTNVCMAYGEGAPLILKDVSFTVNAGEKIGIVGRTGSGKSSLTVALFRLVELTEGKIEIDHVDISEISLEQLRTKLSIIPQDPTLFSGTLRSNLDPFKLCSDAEIWEALEKTQLKSRVLTISGHLDATIGFGGDNLSVGERQLLCLTRALLRDTKILVLDEATAAVDPETEIAVQSMIQREFSHCTVLTIAHRLRTVLPLNRILVINEGKILEFDTPSNLLRNKNSEFFKMLASAEQATNHNE